MELIYNERKGRMITAGEALVAVKNHVAKEGALEAVLSVVEKEISRAANAGEFKVELSDQEVRLPGEKGYRNFWYISTAIKREVVGVLSAQGFVVEGNLDYRNTPLYVSWDMAKGVPALSGVKSCAYCKASVISDKLKDVLVCPVCGANL